MGGIFCRFTVGRAGTAEANARYITRETATGSDEKSVLLHNYPAHIRSSDYDRQRKQIVEYNRQREQDELARKRSGGGTTRTHYRCKVSFEGKVSTEKAHEMIREYLEKSFPTARAVAAVHQDTRHTHVHINIQARGTDDRKLHLNEGKFKHLDSAWGRIYGRELGREKAVEHELKKEEMREWKREYAEARSRGEKPLRPAPQRADRRLRTEEHRAREARNYGIDQTGAGGDQRETPGRERAAAAGERAISRSVELSKQTYGEARQALREAGGALPDVAGVRAELARMGERARGRDREEGGIER